MAEYLIKKDTLQSIAESIRTQIDNSSVTMTTAQMSEKIQNINQEKFLSYINKKNKQAKFEDITNIRTRAFSNHTNLTEIDFPNAINIGDYAFNYCTKLNSINLPLVTSIEGEYAFADCTSLTSLSLPSLLDMGDYTFYGCNKLVEINLPKVNTIANNAFRNCTQLSTVNFPEAEKIASYAFYNCDSLRTVYFPLVTTVGTYAFNHCYALTTVDFPMVTGILDNTFGSCSNLTALILRSKTIVTLSSTSAFYSTPIASGTGYIYVPASLIDSYKTETNWSTYTAQFRAIEDYPDICGTTETESAE